MFKSNQLLTGSKKYACLLLLFVVATTVAAQTTSSFTSISNDLVNNEVTSIVQDKNGFIWFGTRGGLQRFDGYGLKLLKNDFSTGENLLSQSIEVLLPGKQNKLWIGTKSGGLSRYDLKTGNVSNYNLDVQNKGELNTDYILSLLESSHDQLLVGTWQGFGVLNTNNGQFTVLNKRWKTFDIQLDGAGGYWLATNSGLRHLNAYFQNDRSYDFGVNWINITSIVKDTRAGCLWLGTWDQGLIKFIPGTGSYKFYKSLKNDSTSLRSNNTYRLLLDSKGDLWVGTWGGGLHRFDTSREQFEKVQLRIPGLFTTDDQIILTIMQDPSGLLWVGTDGAGVFKYDLNQKRFTNIGYNNSQSLLASTHVLSVYVDPFKKLWVGTKGGAIQYSEDWIHFREFRSRQPVANTSPLLQGRSFLQEKDYLWIATDRGLYRILNTKNKIGDYELFLPQPDDSLSIRGRKMNVLVKDASGSIWVGTQEDGLSRITGYTATGQPRFKHYLPAFGVKGALQNERVSSLLVDSRKRLWVGTYKGLHLYDPASDRFQVYFQNSDKTSSLTNNTILCLAEDYTGNIWAGTQSGLNKISGVNGDQLVVTGFTTRNGFPNDYIHAVITDKQGNVWASTNKGIVRFSQEKKSVTVFDKRDGISSVVFSENASYKDETGRFFYGGIEGLTYFHPDSIRISQFSPPVYFTNLKVNNQPYEFSNAYKKSDSSYHEPFYETKSVTFDHNENIISIEFAALDFHAPDKNEYMYKLQGFHKDWVNAGNNRTVSFTNLKPGTYQLMVKATNSDKIWSSQVQTLEINVLPPPWKTWWAYTLYVAVFIFLLWLTRYLGLRQELLKTQLRLSNLARQQEHELTDFKERLFTNISHEFRTPLTLILGPLEDMLQRRKLDQPLEKSLRLIQKQSRRMLRMVNQLLDYQKAEAGSLKLTAQPGEIVSFCYDIFILFNDEAARRRINYQFESGEKYISFTFDHNKLEIMIFNILSNAFKFTPDGETIRLTVRRNPDQSCAIIVTDTGKGIAADYLGRIFDRFYRGQEKDATKISGTGIGLSFVKELTELHGGVIEAASDGKTGSTFTVTLPPAAVSSQLLSATGEPILIPNQHSNGTFKTETMPEETDAMMQEQDQPIILVVEDEPDMLQYVYEILSPSYKVFTATNGREGIEKAFEIIPDLIVSDVMMPEVDGIELCRKIKSDKTTSHIPVILLTALSDMQHHVQGIREGADVYLPKPFNSQLLLVHIHNLINIRNTLKELYAKMVFLGSGNFEIQSYEEEFLNKLMKLVEENISNSNFNNDELAHLMFMSRSTFYRKLKAVTGMTGNEFIRTARLNYAAKLLESGKYSVTEAAYESGFNDIKYFRKRFHDQFGVSPSEFKK